MMTKSDMITRALEGHVQRLKKTVSYGLGTQPDNSVEYRHEGTKLELRAYQSLLKGNTMLAKVLMNQAEEWYTRAVRR